LLRKLFRDCSARGDDARLQFGGPHLASPWLKPRASVSPRSLSFDENAMHSRPWFPRN
jgi:hypothetical protein